MFTVQSVSVCACSLGKKCSSGVFYLQQQRGDVTVGKVNNIGHALFHLRFFPSTHFSLWFYHHILLDWDNYALHICSRMWKHDVWRVFVRGMNTTQSLWKSCVFPQVCVWLTTELDPMCTGGFCFQLHTPLPQLGQEILSSSVFPTPRCLETASDPEQQVIPLPPAFFSPFCPPLQWRMSAPLLPLPSASSLCRDPVRYHFTQAWRRLRQALWRLEAR